MITTITSMRTPFFRENPAAEVVTNALRHYHENRHVHGFAWVVMPDHIHWVLRTPPSRIWMPGYHDRLLREN